MGNVLLDNMLIGQESGKIDDKGRISFPRKFRTVLGDKLIVTQGFESSLIVVAKNHWKSLLEGTEGKPFIQREIRETQRFLLGTASEVELDKKGRFVLPDYLRQYAKLGNEVVCLGILRYVEIWDKKNWEDYNKELNKKIDPITTKLSKGE